MIVQEVVRIPGDLVQDDGATLGERYSPRALAVAQNLRSLLAVRLQEESPYTSLWEQFEAEPQAVTAELTGIARGARRGRPSFDQAAECIR